jgi:hypothetical protein
VKSGEKLAKVAGKAGKAVPLLAAALDFYIQYREEKAKEEKARYLANMRLSLRNAFADQTRVEADALEAVVLQVSRGPVSETLDALDAGSTDIASATSDRQALAQDLADVKARCTRLRSQLMSGTGDSAKEA